MPESRSGKARMACMVSAGSLIECILPSACDDQHPALPARVSRVRAPVNTTLCLKSDRRSSNRDLPIPLIATRCSYVFSPHAPSMSLLLPAQLMRGVSPRNESAVAAMVSAMVDLERR